MATRVGYIGLGDMGKAMASNLAPVASEAYQGFVKIQMYDAEKHPAQALEPGRSWGIALPAAGIVSQEMARICRGKDAGRRWPRVGR